MHVLGVRLSVCPSMEQTLLLWPAGDIDRLLHGAQHSWRRGVVVSGVRRMNEVNARRARLQLGWVTVFERVYHLGL